ncbi:CapA family protein [Nitrospira moscoviensis]|uniref:CapA family protein n=1 Tax=Nitrospira moscoviensis TaxID=42253 RepID=UPI0011AEA955|nr:CapA family protein [Nitrospira moscoviensis]
MKIALTGDVMLGRLVDQYVTQNRSICPEALWGDVLPSCSQPIAGSSTWNA